MPSYFYRLILAISLLLPFAAQASDAGDFAAASSSRQAELLEAWAASPVPERIELLEALRDGRVAADSSKRAWIENNDNTGQWMRMRLRLPTLQPLTNRANCA